MNQADALYTVARAYPGGLEALALRMGMSVNVLRNKLRPSINTHHINSEEESLIIEFCEEAKVADALQPLVAKNWRHGLIAFPRPPVDVLSDDDLTKALCKAVKEFSDLSSAASETVSHRNITHAEMEAIEKEAQEALAAIEELRYRIHSRAQP
ncbi:hypothetical protein D3870_09790 [Noviherbaspirillum cavernae]|uniref:Uncharacterized protein n=2 Tax=Noviherbaspirillum cavernae TaxID=2320862 RepID=A0A418X1D7_9BURK|nr:hypothetical protein D3870_09790 [Noviherbaspirillum cavernae]